MSITKITNPAAWIILCILAQLYGASQEIFCWKSFSASVLGLPVYLEKTGMSAADLTGALELTGLLAKNQGFYNLFIVAGFLLALMPWLTATSRITLAIFSLACMSAAGFFGLATVAFSEITLGIDKPEVSQRGNVIAFSLQALPPLVALLGIRLRGGRIS